MSACECPIRPGVIFTSAGLDTKETTIKWTEANKIILSKQARPGMKTSGLGLTHEAHEQDGPALPAGSRARNAEGSEAGSRTLLHPDLPSVPSSSKHVRQPTYSAAFP